MSAALAQRPTMDLLVTGFGILLAERLPRRAPDAAVACLLCAGLLARTPPGIELAALVRAARAQWNLRGLQARLDSDEWPRGPWRLVVPRQADPAMREAVEAMLEQIVVLSREGHDVSGALAVLLALAAKLYETSWSTSEAAFVAAAREAEERVIPGWFEMGENFAEAHP